jgi:hypothetical protein
VLRWTWGSREEPFTVGDLHRSLSEIRHNRIGKIAMVAEQADILDAKPSRDNRDDGRRDDGRRDARDSREQRYIEPRIGGPAR